jgi:hypothetical protein
VNMKPLQKLISLSLILAALAVSVRAKGNVDISAPEDLGDSTLKISVEATSTFNRDLDQMKLTAREAAENYCASHNKQLRVVYVDGKKPFPTTGFTKAWIVFRALDSNSPELAPPAPAVPMAAAAAPAATLSAKTDDLAAALTKLEDLRKKGFLTEDEFQEQKKKLLEHTF